MDALTPLPDFDVMRREIEEAHEVAGVAGIRDQAIALETYARRARNTGAEREAVEIQLLAMRKADRKWKGRSPEQRSPRNGNQDRCTDEPAQAQRPGYHQEGKPDMAKAREGAAEQVRSGAR